MGIWSHERSSGDRPRTLNRRSISTVSEYKKMWFIPTANLSYKVDWLSFTKKTGGKDPNITIRKILDYLGYDLTLFQEIPPRYFFNSGLSLGNFVNVFWNDPAKKQAKNASEVVSFHFTGVGSTDISDRLERICDSKDAEANWIKFFKFLISQECKFTRVDLALDDFEGLNNFDLMERKLHEGRYRSVKKTYSISRGADQKGKSSGFTIYLGKPVKTSKGFYLLRMYKKLDEFKAKGQLLPSLPRKTGHWDRYELEFTKDKAVSIINKIINEGAFSPVFLGVLRSTVEFLNPKHGKNGQILKNKDRWEVCYWWEKFLRGAEKVRVGSDAGREVELAYLLSWIRKEVVPSLKLLEIIGTERNFNIYELIRACDVNFSKKQRRLYLNSKVIPDRTLRENLIQFVEGYKE